MNALQETIEGITEDFVSFIESLIYYISTIKDKIVSLSPDKIFFIGVFISSSFFCLNLQFNIKDELCDSIECKKKYHDLYETNNLIFSVILLLILMKYYQTSFKLKKRLKLLKLVKLPIFLIFLIIGLIMTIYATKTDELYKKIIYGTLSTLFYIMVGVSIFFGFGLTIVPVGTIVTISLMFFLWFFWIPGFSFYSNSLEIKNKDPSNAKNKIQEKYGKGFTRIYPKSFLASMVMFSFVFLIM